MTITLPVSSRNEDECFGGDPTPCKLPQLYSFIHIPAQSGKQCVWLLMLWEAFVFTSFWLKSNLLEMMCRFQWTLLNVFSCYLRYQLTCFLRTGETGGTTHHHNSNMFHLHTQRCSTVRVTTSPRSAALGRAHTQKMVSCCVTFSFFLRQGRQREVDSWLWVWCTAAVLPILNLWKRRI